MAISDAATKDIQIGNPCEVGKANGIAASACWLNRIFATAFDKMSAADFHVCFAQSPTD